MMWAVEIDHRGRNIWRKHDGCATICQAYVVAMIEDVFVSCQMVMASASQWEEQLVCDNYFKFVCW